MSENQIVDSSSPGAVTLARSCNGTKNCTKLDFIFSDDVSFPLTFKVLTTIEGTYNHTSATVTVSNNTNIRSCDYSTQDDNSTCGSTQCCGMGKRNDNRTQSNICSGDKSNDVFVSPDTGAFPKFNCEFLAGEDSNEDDSTEDNSNDDDSTEDNSNDDDSTEDNSNDDDSNDDNSNEDNSNDDNSNDDNSNDDDSKDDNNEESTSEADFTECGKERCNDTKECCSTAYTKDANDFCINYGIGCDESTEKKNVCSNYKNPEKNDDKYVSFVCDNALKLM